MSLLLPYPDIFDEFDQCLVFARLNQNQKKKKLGYSKVNRIKDSKNLPNDRRCLNDLFDAIAMIMVCFFIVILNF